MEVAVTVSELHRLVDFGMFGMLWLVQLVIYPSFLRVDAAQLVDWHRSYTFRVSFLIIPLMFAQLGLATLAAFGREGRAMDWLVLGLVVLCWGLTFFVSVPLHRKIELGDQTLETRRALVLTNWPRTVLWTWIFGLGCLSWLGL